MIIVSLSGGKDSTACLLLALKQYNKKDIIPVFADTKFEHSAVYEYLDYLERKLKVKIERVESRKYNGLLDCIEKRKTFPGGNRRFCTYELKLYPIWMFIKNNKLENGESWIGIRSNESKQRNEKYGEYEKSETIDYELINPKVYKPLRKMQVRLPVLNLSAMDCMKIIKENGVEINPLYKMGFERVGCFPCIISGLKDYKRVWQNCEGKKNIQELFELEKKFNNNGNDTRIKANADRHRLKKIFKMADDQISLFDITEYQCMYCQI